MVFCQACWKAAAVSRIANSTEGWSAILNKLLICRDTSDENALLARLVNWNGPCVLSFANAHALNLAWKDQTYVRYLIEPEITVRDGIGMRLLMKLTGREPGLNLNGTDFIPKLLESLPRNRHIAVYGTREPYLAQMLLRLRTMNFETIHMENGFHDDEYYVSLYLKQLPSVVLLAMGMPKQERISLLLRAVSAGRPVLIINGGAIVDFMADRFPRAPLWMRKAGMEWVFRWMQEPGRLLHRNLGYFQFMMRALLMRIIER
jgi:N-acetylglucosaminyldiphosphoundecaprenol N-acetyl-beta-D-mannosaminyltransferase